MTVNVPTNPAPPKAAPKGGASSRTRSERKLAWMLCAPAVLAMLLVTAYPIVYAVSASTSTSQSSPPTSGGRTCSTPSSSC
jgi:multiple sugar transport system permease protein